MDILSVFLDLPLFIWIILGVYLLSFIIQLIYYLSIFRRPYRYLSKRNKDTNKQLPDIEHIGISIIITAKNEADNLRKNLPSILEQDYPNFQVVVVNNGSTDSTEYVLNEMRNNYPTKLYTTFIPVDYDADNDKKLALTIGIKAAKHDILLFTEADTKPLTEKWVNEYAKEFMEGKDVVLGGCQLKIEKGFYRKLILFGNLMFGVKYLSMALIKKPYMGIERNMAYRKSLFFENRGFSSLLNIEYGEDNLFINKIANKKNTSVVVSLESMVESDVVDRLSTWRTIKGKYLITKHHLKGCADKVLSFEVLSRYVFYLLFAAMCIIGALFPAIILIGIAITLFLIRYIVQLIVINKNSKLYNSGKYIFSLPFLDIFTPILNHQFLKYKKRRNKKR